MVKAKSNPVIALAECSLHTSKKEHSNELICYAP